MRIRASRWAVTALIAASSVGPWMASLARAEAAAAAPWEVQNPLKPLPAEPLGVAGKLAALPNPPTPETVRLGRWLYFDKRLSADGTIACATCHKPENAFSETTPVSTGIRGQKGGRKAPSFVNQAWTLTPFFFWDGRAASLEEQALGPVANPIEMGNTVEVMLATLKGIPSYPGYFKQAFGDENVTKERVAKAIADYERTRMSGSSPWDKWKAGDEKAVSQAVKNGSNLFFGKALCMTCHLGPNFTDGQFHNLGVGWDAAAAKFKDEGRSKISGKAADTGAFKTPTVRDVAKHAPFMHDGSVATLKDVVEHYNKGGNANPHLDPRMVKLNLSATEVDELVAFMEALDGEGYQDTAPTAFPQ